MSRDPIDFATSIVRARVRYEAKIGDWLGAQKKVYGEATYKRQILRGTNEAQIRQAIIDPLLNSLNWNLEQSIVVEGLVGDGRRHFDYAGVEEGDGDIALLVEAKRPSYLLPSLMTDKNVPLATRLAAALDAIKQELAPPGPLELDDFIEHLFQVWKYVNDIAREQAEPLRRAVLTNGEWLVVFANPLNAFVTDERVEPVHIHIFASERDILRRKDEVYKLLEKNRCLKVPFLRSVAEVRGFISPGDLVSVLYGLAATLDSQRGLSWIRPNLSVEPVLVVRGNGPKWVIVSTGEILSLPHREAEVDEHILECSRHAAALHEQLNADVGREVPCLTIVEHYADDEARLSLPAALNIGRQQYLFIGGTSAHFIGANAEYASCVYHGLSSAEPRNLFVREVPSGPSEEMRTFQTSGTSRCCASSIVRGLKSAEFTPSNPDEAKIKSPREQSVFCKVLAVETHLCCKACNFNSICGVYTLSRSPCRTN